MKDWTIVFDLDGTLVDTAPDLARATNHAIGKAGLSPVALDLIRPTVSHGARAMIVHALEIHGRMLEDARVDELLEVFLEYYAANIAVDSRPYQDVPAVLKRLRGRGSRLAVCTNKREALSRKLLSEIGLISLFDAVVGRDTLPVHKPDPGHLIGTVILADGDLGRAIMVGDSEVDVKTAKAAGIPVVGVSFGYTVKPVKSFEPEGLIDHYRDLEDEVRRLSQLDM
jgi:phosphoglycolate phosphatase